MRGRKHSPRPVRECHRPRNSLESTWRRLSNQEKAIGGDEMKSRLEDPLQVGRFVEVGDMRIFYRSSGEGEPILLLHGFPTSSYDWRRFIEALSGFGKIIAPDLYGFGYSDSPKDAEYTLTGYLGFLKDFLNTMGVKRFTAIGHDWGSYLALGYALENPGAVTGLVLTTFLEDQEWLNWARGSVAHPVYSTIRRGWVNPLSRWVFRLILSRKGLKKTLPSIGLIYPETILSDEVLDQWVLLFRRSTKNAWKLYTESNLRIVELKLPEYEAKARELDIPTLLIVPRDDPVGSMAAAERLHEALRNSTLHALEKTGHFLLEERPEQVIELITSFLQRSNSGES